MTPNFRALTAISATALAAVFSGCGPSDPNGFTVVDALGNYDVSFQDSVALKSTYHNHTALSKTVSSAQLGLTPSNVSGIGIAYDSARNCFTITSISGTPATTSTVEVAGSAVTAIDEGGVKVDFTPTTAHLKSVTLTMPLAGATSVQKIDTGCEQLSSVSLTITLTADGIDAGITVERNYQSVAYTGTLPYVSCADYLAGVEATIRGAGTDTSGLQTFVVNGGINIDFLSDLITVSEKLSLSGTKAAASASTSLVIQNGPITELKILQ